MRKKNSTNGGHYQNTGLLTAQRQYLRGDADTICAVVFCRTNSGFVHVTRGFRHGIGGVFFYVIHRVCEFLALRSQHFCCFEIPDCTVHTSYNRRPEADCVIRACKTVEMELEPLCRYCRLAAEKTLGKPHRCAASACEK